MKKLLIILSIVFFYSCSKKTENQKLCVKTISYKSQKNNLIPSLIEIKIDGDNGRVLQKIEAGKLDGIILFSIKKEFRGYFPMFQNFEKDKNPIKLKILTSFFDSNSSFENKNIKKFWTQKEIEKLIKGDVGLIFKNDTIIIKYCEKK